MLKLRLKELMEQRGLNVSDLSLITGLNRASLTQLLKNKSKMVKFETLDRLINALQVTDVYELFEIRQAGSIEFVGHELLSDNSFATNLSVYFEPVMGEEVVEQNVKFTFTIKKLVDGVFVLRGVPEQGISDKVDNVFTWLTRLSISRFLHVFIYQVFGVSPDYFREEPIQKVFSQKTVDAIIQKDTQLFLSFSELPMLSSVFEIGFIDDNPDFILYPDEEELYSRNKSDEIEPGNDSVSLKSRLFL